MDGVETLRRLREVAPLVSVIMVTANEDVGLARETLKLGALDYVAKPFDFVYLERAVLAGLAQAGAGQAAGLASGDAWRELALAVFQAVRGMTAVPRASTGARLEEAVLAAAREAVAGRRQTAALALDEVELLLGLAAELHDLTGADLTVVQGAVERARQALRSAG
jgi:DNA-binding response OmpR family regulator